MGHSSGSREGKGEMTKVKVVPVTLDGKKYEKRYYSDRSGGGERDRPTTSGFAPSLRERHTGFSPVRQVRPSTAGRAQAEGAQRRTSSVRHVRPLRRSRRHPL